MTLDEYLNAKDMGTGETWLQFCWKRGFTVEEMMSGFERQNQLEASRDPDGPRANWKMNLD